jgi:hypothetical protein
MIARFLAFVRSLRKQENQLPEWEGWLTYWKKGTMS